MDCHNSIELLLESTCFLFEENLIQPVVKLIIYSANNTKYLPLMGILKENINCRWLENVSFWSFQMKENICPPEE